MSDENTNPEQTLSKIKSRGYWEVIIRPLKFEKERIMDLPECLKIVEESRIQLRGWDYPHVGHHPAPYCGIDYVESFVDWDEHKEFWRMYQSGQFVHLFALHEDWLGEQRPLFGGVSKYASIKPMSILEITMTLWSMTEIYQFAMELSKKGLFDGTAAISLKLHGLLNRRLSSFDIGWGYLDGCVCHIDILPREKEIPIKILIEQSAEIAVNETLEVLKRFNWQSPPIESLEKSQHKLLTRSFP